MTKILDVLKRTLTYLPDELRAAAQKAIADSERDSLIHDRLQLTPTEKMIFDLLSANPGVVVKRSEFGIKSKNSLEVQKHRVKKKLEKAGIGTIKTELGEGYRLVLWSQE